MRKILPYILAGIILVAAAFLVFTGNNKNDRRLDERLSFRKKDKIPYGTYVAYESLQYLFPKAHISFNSNGPGYWDSLSNYDSGQALIIVSPTFRAEAFELKKIIRFIENGNDVFISSAIVSDDTKNILNCAISYVDWYDLVTGKASDRDTLGVSLSNPPFSRSYNYIYPGKRLDAHFLTTDSVVTTELGADIDGNPDFIHFKAGKGNLYLHLAPMSFCNYFLLRGNNIKYYEDILSVIPPTTKTIVWDEYYLYKREGYGNRSDDDDDRGGNAWLKALFSYPALKWALLTALFTLLLYALLEMRRKQRYIPVITKPRNDSLDFVKTIGRLYYDKGDHKNLCRKMASYFLEHVRNRYKLPTAELNDEFIRALQFKTGISEEEIRGIVYFVRDMELAPAISDHQLKNFHRQLESFYSKA